MNELLDIYEKKSSNWQQFLSLTLSNIEEIDNNIQQTETKRTQLEDTIEHIGELSQHAQATAFIKLCPRAYITATIKHTGEYNVELNSEYQCTLTKDQTIEFLKEQVAEQKGILENYRTQKEQLEKRLNFNSNEDDDLPDITSMPEKIICEKGIAFKQGPFYEIMEVEPKVPYIKNTKRISRVKENCEISTINISDLNIHT